MVEAAVTAGIGRLVNNRPIIYVEIIADNSRDPLLALRTGNLAKVNRPSFPRHSPSSGNSAFQTPLAIAA